MQPVIMYPCKQQCPWGSLRAAPLSPAKVPSLFSPCTAFEKETHMEQGWDRATIGDSVWFSVFSVLSFTRILPLWFYCFVEEKPCGCTKIWFLWQREQQACCSAIQHTSGVLKSLFVVEGHGTPKASPTVAYSSAAEDPSLPCRPSETLCPHCPLSSISRP